MTPVALFRALALLAPLTAGCASRAERAGAGAAPRGGSVTEFRNAHWFDGKAFVSGRFFSVGGLLTQREPAQIDAQVDLGGAYVVPPFAEAHNHNVETAWDVEQVVAQYLRDGVFYVKITGDIPELALAVRDRLNRPDSIDVVFAHAGLTGPGGWPSTLYREIAGPMRYEPMLGKLPDGWFEERAYFVVSSAQQLDAKWPRLIQSAPDLIKVYLECSESFGLDDPACGGRTGLDPRLLPALVERARGARLSVVAHVLTAADFRSAVSSGVREIGHLPGWFLAHPGMTERARLSEEDAKLAAEQGVRVTTTTVASRSMAVFRKGEWADASAPGHAPGHGHGPEPSAGTPVAHALEAEREVQLANLTLLKRAGVTLLIGSDHAETPLAEALHLQGMGLFTNLELLRMWCETTPQAVFPGRRIGRLADGFEANFVALAADPIESFERVKQIRLRVKAGRILPDPGSAPAEGRPSSHH